MPNTAIVYRVLKSRLGAEDLHLDNNATGTTLDPKEP